MKQRVAQKHTVIKYHFNKYSTFPYVIQHKSFYHNVNIQPKTAGPLHWTQTPVALYYSMYFHISCVFFSTAPFPPPHNNPFLTSAHEVERCILADPAVGTCNDGHLAVKAIRTLTVSVSRPHFAVNIKEIYSVWYYRLSPGSSCCNTIHNNVLIIWNTFNL